MSKAARKRSKKARRSKHRAYRGSLIETPSAKRHKRLLRAEIVRERMIRAMVRRQHEWDELVECMEADTSALQQVREDWRVHGDLERLRYDEDMDYKLNDVQSPRCRLDRWERVVLNRMNDGKSEPRYSLPDSAYEATRLMEFLPDVEAHQR